jgi:DNA-binding CsgD family transcriptional regulator
LKHIDILIHAICLTSGIITALLGYLLYLKYRIKAMLSYSFFILTTTFTVAATTFFSYATYFMNKGAGALSRAIGMIVFGALLSLINYSFSLFSFGIINKKLYSIHKILIAIPWLLIPASIATLALFNVKAGVISIPSLINLNTGAILAILFLSFVLCSIQIFINLKNIENPDLKAALKVLSILFIIFIPFQALIIIFIKKALIIFLSRNLFYLTVNVISIVFAAKYFFIRAPSIMGKIELSSNFIKKYSITKREREIIYLLLSGLSIKEIGFKLNRSFKTINNHIYNIYQKASISSKLELLNLINENKI